MAGPGGVRQMSREAGTAWDRAGGAGGRVRRPVMGGEPVPSERASLRHVKRIPSLDGLRAVALGTVLLAHLLLGERLTRAQQAGVAVALAGVCAIAAG